MCESAHAADAESRSRRKAGCRCEKQPWRNPCKSSHTNFWKRGGQKQTGTHGQRVTPAQFTVKEPELHFTVGGASYTSRSPPSMEVVRGTAYEVGVTQTCNPPG